MPRPLAVLSDVHANRYALRSVLADLDGLGVDEIVVAGDMVGFGPHPNEVVEELRARGAAMIRGNHEKDYVAPYATASMPDRWLTDRRLATLRWQMERLGPETRRFLTDLPDRLDIDDATTVFHGSPRHVRDAVLPWRTDEELEAMFAGDPARLAFMGHTHRPVDRRLPTRRLVNVGSVGMPLDGDPRASYVLAWLDEGAEATIELRRVPYDVEAAVAAYRDEVQMVDTGYVEIMTRQLRTGRDYFGPWLRLSKELPDDALDEALNRYLDAHP